MIAFVGMQKRRHGNNANISAKSGIITHTLAIATLKRGLLKFYAPLRLRSYSEPSTAEPLLFGLVRPLSKAWKGLKANPHTGALKGESMPYLHGLKPPPEQSFTAQSYDRSVVDAQNDAQITSGRRFLVRVPRTAGRRDPQKFVLNP